MPTRPSRVKRGAQETQRTSERPMFCPFTTGGDRLDVEKVANFGPEHFEQRDKSLNRKLWSLYQLTGDWDTQRQQTLHDMHMKNAYKIMDFPDGGQFGPFDIDRMRRAIPEFELGRVASIMENLSLMESALFNAEVQGEEPTMGQLEEMEIPIEILHERKQLEMVKPLSEAVRGATELKNNANELFGQRKYLEAMRQFVRAQLYLYPWTGSPLIFTGEEAFRLGIAPLEGIIWSNMAMTAQRLAVTTGNERWIGACRGCCQVLLESRYVTPLLYTKAFKRMTDTARMLIAMGDTMYEVELGVTDRSLQKVQSAVDTDPAQSSTRWAHSGCWARHSTCIGVDSDEAAAAKQQAFVDNGRRQEEERRAAEGYQ